MTDEAAAAEWAGPPRFLPPPLATRRADGSRVFSGVTYACPAGYRPLQLDLWVPPGSTPTPFVVWIHGGAWMMGDRRYLPETLSPDSLFEAFLAAELAVATIDYRFSLEAPFPAQLHDAKAAVRYLRAHADVLGIDGGRIGVAGESAGGHLAALVALTGHRADLEGDLGVLGPSSGVAAAVDWYGVSDLSTMPGVPPPPQVAAKLPEAMRVPAEEHLTRGLEGAALADASPLTHVTPEAPPFLLLHGTADRVVPFSQSERLHAALRAVDVPVRLVPVEGADHIFAGHGDVDALVALSADYLSEALR
jgi:acetyl esterase/lipase